MTRRLYQPGPLARVDAERDGERWTLVFVRELRHPIQSVWRALTDPGQLEAWAPFDVDRDLGRAGSAQLTMAGAGKQEPMEIAVEHAEAPSLLVYTWGPDRLRWELAAIDAGTRLTLRHTVQDVTWLAKVAAGWHICLDVADRHLSGDPVGRIVGEDAKNYGWEELDRQYEAVFAKKTS